MATRSVKVPDEVSSANEAERRLKVEGLVTAGQRIVILSGTGIEQPGGTNLMKLHEVE